METEDGKHQQQRQQMDYRDAGVDLEAGRDFVTRIRSSVERTRRPEVVGGLGGFSGVCRLPAGLRQPLLVSSTDGVGTKLELAQRWQAHHAVGIDLVAMCANDVITSGAEPLFFLDYIATGRLGPEALTEVVAGIASACTSCGCALLGGETAEMPGFYADGSYDLAGFCTGVVEADGLLDGSRIAVTDSVIALASSGPHSNGFSLIRKLLHTTGADPGSSYVEGESRSLREWLMAPTRLYGPLVTTLRQARLPLHGMAHITGGGLPENLPRCLPQGTSVALDPGSWTVPPFFRWLQRQGEIPEPALWNTFNLGVGFCLVVPRTATAAVLECCRQAGEIAWLIGSVVPGDGGLQGVPR